MATTINTISIRSIPTITSTVSFTNATCSTASTAEIFEADIDAADGKWYIEIDNSNASSAVSVSIVGGSYVGAKDKNLGSIGAGAVAVLYADSSMCKAENGKLRISLKPLSGSLSGNGVKLHAVQFLPAQNK